MEAARTMLEHRKLPKKLWGEANNTAVYTLNRSVNKNTSNMTTYEKYWKEKPRVSHLRVFGSLAMMKLQEKKRSGYQKKLDSRSQACVLVRYDRDYTYRVYEPKTNKVIITREVEIDETKTLNLTTGEDEYNFVLIQTMQEDIAEDEQIEESDNDNGQESNNEEEI